MRISAGLTSFALSICIFALGEQICNVQPVHAQEVAKQFALCKSYQYKYSVNFCQNDGYACYDIARSMW